MTDTSTPSEPTPAPPTRRRHGNARRRRLAFLLAAIILLVAGVVTGVIVTRPAPKRHKVVAVVKPKPAPKPVNHDLTLAAFMSRWNRLVAGPSDVALAPVAFEGPNGQGGQQLVPLSVVVESPDHWAWDIPAIAIGGSSSAAMAFSATPTGGVEHVGPLTNSGLTIFGPVTGIYGPGALAVLDNSLPAPDATELIQGEPIPALADPQIVSASKATWTVHFNVLWPTCYAVGTPRICGAGLPPAEFPPATRSPSGIGAGAGAGGDLASATVAVTPTATGGLQIALAPGTINAEPTGAS